MGFVGCGGIENIFGGLVLSSNGIAVVVCVGFVDAGLGLLSIWILR